MLKNFTRPSLYVPLAVGLMVIVTVIIIVLVSTRGLSRRKVAAPCQHDFSVPSQLNVPGNGGGGGGGNDGNSLNPSSFSNSTNLPPDITSSSNSLSSSQQQKNGITTDQITFQQKYPTLLLSVKQPSTSNLALSNGDQKALVRMADSELALAPTNMQSQLKARQLIEQVKVAAELLSKITSSHETIDSQDLIWICEKYSQNNHDFLNGLSTNQRDLLNALCQPKPDSSQKVLIESILAQKIPFSNQSDIDILKKVENLDEKELIEVGLTSKQADSASYMLKMHPLMKAVQEKTTLDQLLINFEDQLADIEDDNFVSLSAIADPDLVSTLKEMIRGDRGALQLISQDKIAPAQINQLREALACAALTTEQRSKLQYFADHLALVEFISLSPNLTLQSLQDATTPASVRSTFDSLQGDIQRLRVKDDQVGIAAVENLLNDVKLVAQIRQILQSKGDTDVFNATETVIINGVIGRLATLGLASTEQQLIQRLIQNGITTVQLEQFRTQYAQLLSFVNRPDSQRRLADLILPENALALTQLQMPDILVETMAPDTAKSIIRQLKLDLLVHHNLASVLQSVPPAKVLPSTLTMVQVERARDHFGYDNIIRQQICNLIQRVNTYAPVFAMYEPLVTCFSTVGHRTLVALPANISALLNSISDSHIDILYDLQADRNAIKTLRQNLQLRNSILEILNRHSHNPSSLTKLVDKPLLLQAQPILAELALTPEQMASFNECQELFDFSIQESKLKQKIDDLAVSPIETKIATIMSQFNWTKSLCDAVIPPVYAFSHIEYAVFYLRSKVIDGATFDTFYPSLLMLCQKLPVEVHGDATIEFIRSILLNNSRDIAKVDWFSPVCPQEAAQVVTIHDALNNNGFMPSPTEDIRSLLNRVISDPHRSTLHGKCRSLIQLINEPQAAFQERFQQFTIDQTQCTETNYKLLKGLFFRTSLVSPVAANFQQYAIRYFSQEFRRNPFATIDTMFPGISFIADHIAADEMDQGAKEFRQLFANKTKDALKQSTYNDFIIQLRGMLFDDLTTFNKDAIQNIVDKLAVDRKSPGPHTYAPLAENNIIIPKDPACTKENLIPQICNQIINLGVNVRLHNLIIDFIDSPECKPNRPLPIKIQTAINAYNFIKSNASIELEDLKLESDNPKSVLDYGRLHLLMEIEERIRDHLIMPKPPFNPVEMRKDFERFYSKVSRIGQGEIIEFRNIQTLIEDLWQEFKRIKIKPLIHRYRSLITRPLEQGIEDIEDMEQTNLQLLKNFMTNMKDLFSFKDRESNFTGSFSIVLSPELSTDELKVYMRRRFLDYRISELIRTFLQARSKVKVNDQLEEFNAKIFNRLYDWSPAKAYTFKFVDKLFPSINGSLNDKYYEVDFDLASVPNIVESLKVMLQRLLLEYHVPRHVYEEGLKNETSFETYCKDIIVKVKQLEDPAKIGSDNKENDLNSFKELIATSVYKYFVAKILFDDHFNYPVLLEKWNSLCSKINLGPMTNKSSLYDSVFKKKYPNEAVGDVSEDKIKNLINLRLKVDCDYKVFSKLENILQLELCESDREFIKKVSTRDKFEMKVKDLFNTVKKPYPKPIVQQAAIKYRDTPKTIDNEMERVIELLNVLGVSENKYFGPLRTLYNTYLEVKPKFAGDIQLGLVKSRLPLKELGADTENSKLELFIFGDGEHIRKFPFLRRDSSSSSRRTHFAILPIQEGLNYSYLMVQNSDKVFQWDQSQRKFIYLDVTIDKVPGMESKHLPKLTFSEEKQFIFKIK